MIPESSLNDRCFNAMTTVCYIKAPFTGGCFPSAVNCFSCAEILFQAITLLHDKSRSPHQSYLEF